jgi:Flp pilus assembly protein TadD
VHAVTGKEPAALEEAASFFREVIEVEPDFGRAHFLLGVCLERLGRLAEAAPHLERAALHEADDPVVLDLLARARADAGDISGAAQVHYRAATLSPKDPRILRNAALSLLRAGFIDEGLSMANISLGIEPGQEDLITLIRDVSETARRAPKGRRWTAKIAGLLRGKKE